MEKLQANKMGVMPINKLIINMSLPMMISMLVMALYNVVDSMFVSMISEQALTAVSTAFPVQNLMIAVSTGTGVGLNALISKSLGEKNRALASKYAQNGIFLALCSYAVFLVAGLTLMRAFFTSQTNDSVIVEYGVQYSTIVTVLSFGLFGEIAFERLMQSTGKTFYSMVTQGVGAIINMIFDPIFIFTFKLGVAGAAYATVFGQIISVVIAFFLNKYKNPEIELKFKGFKPDLELIKRIYIIGIPSIIMASISSVMFYGVNKIVITMNKTAAAVFGVYFKLQSFIFMPVFGLNNGIIPIIGYNYGAQNKTRIMKTFRLGVLYSFIIMIVGIIIFQTLPKELLLLFKASDNMLNIGIPALRIISLSFIFAGIDIVIGSLFQAFGYSVFSMIISMTRQLVVLLPVAYMLSLTGKIDNVWWAFPISEVASLIASLAFFAIIYRKKIKFIRDGDR